MSFFHKNLGPVEVTEACLQLQKANPDSTSMFVEHEGDIKEVTAALVEEHSRLDEKPVAENAGERMKTLRIGNHSQLHGNKKMLEALEAGAHAMGWCFDLLNRPEMDRFDAVKPQDILVNWGLSGWGLQALAVAAKRGCDLMMVDYGFIQPALRASASTGYFLFTQMFRRHGSILNEVPNHDRVKRLMSDGLDLLPARQWDTPSKKVVLFVGQAPEAVEHGMTAEALYRSMLGACRKHAYNLNDYTFRFRPHQQDPLESALVFDLFDEVTDPFQMPLAQDLDEAALVVTHNGVEGLEALIHGLPVICSPEAFYAEYAARRWQCVGESSPVLMLDLLARVANTQFTLDEISTGVPFKAWGIGRTDRVA